MKGLREHVDKIVKGLESEEFEPYGEHPDFQDDIDTIQHILDNDTQEFLYALVQAIECQSAHVRASDLGSFLDAHFRGYYHSKGEATEQMLRDRAESSELAWFDKYGKWTDWEGYADTPEMSDLTFVKGEYGVYMFQD